MGWMGEGRQRMGPAGQADKGSEGQTSETAAETAAAHADTIRSLQAVAPHMQQTMLAHVTQKTARYRATPGTPPELPPRPSPCCP